MVNNRPDFEGLGCVGVGQTGRFGFGFRAWHIDSAVGLLVYLRVYLENKPFWIWHLNN